MRADSSASFQGFFSRAPRGGVSLMRAGGCARRVVLEHGAAGLAFGLGLFLFPGFAWAFALGRDLPLASRLALGPVLAFTVAPAVTFTLNLLFDVPIRLDTIAFLSAALGMAGVASLASPRLRALAAD